MTEQSSAQRESAFAAHEGTPDVREDLLRRSSRQEAPLYVVGDVHGHPAELVTALHAAGLTDADGHWQGEDARLWFLGDLLDRGPDGVGVVELAIQLNAEAPDHVDCLLGNHEILTLGMRRWGEMEIPLTHGVGSFGRSWRRNGGQVHDLHGLTEAHFDWLHRRPLITVVDEHLLMHSDTLAYLSYGNSTEEITETMHDVLASDDPAAWWDLWRRLTTRFAFRGDDGPEHAESMLGALGGSRIVHGHSPIPDQLGIDPEESPIPYEYCDGRVLNVDSGLCLGGPPPLARIN